MAARQLLSVLLLPFMVVVVIPRWLLMAWLSSDTRWTPATAAIGLDAGTMILLAGFTLFVWCLSLFAQVGKGTLAPWDPTRRLVAVGPYRYVRNPMITAVITMLIGESVLLGSRVLAIWAAIFLLLNILYFLGFEEPDLQRRFGEEYKRYKAAVPRWIPRRTPWKNV